MVCEGCKHRNYNVETDSVICDWIIPFLESKPSQKEMDKFIDGDCYDKATE